MEKRRLVVRWHYGFPKVPHQLCQFHYLKDATEVLYEADRQDIPQLKKHVRGVRPLERALEERSDPEAEAVRGYCLAVRSSLTDDGRPPLDASGLKLQDRLTRDSAIPSPVSNKKKSLASTEALAAYSHQGAPTHGGAVAAHQGGLWTGVSGRSHFGQSPAADGCPGTGNLPGLDRAYAGAESELGRTEYGHRSFCGENNQLCRLRCFTAMTCQTCRRPIMIWSIVLVSPVRMSAARPDAGALFQGWWCVARSV